MDVTEVAAKWTGADGDIGAYVREESRKSLESYRAQPNNLIEDANLEEDTARGGYANRQIFELVQNSADALTKSDGECIWLMLTPTHLYCADNGIPIDEAGARALLFSHLSSKRGTSEIGRFGLGFKSVLGITDTPEFFSRAGSFRFDRERSAELLRPIAPDSERYPVLRLAEPMDPWPEMEADSNLREMGCWASNIVRLPLKLGAYQSIHKQIEDFPAQFLLFVKHVGRLVLQEDGQESARIVTLARQEDDRWILDDAGRKTRWMIETRLHTLSPDAKSDSRSLDDTDEVPIWWAAPTERLNEPGWFWAFFPTMTPSLLSGILNAPWKTNEDRQNLLTGVYNDELIDAAAKMVADALPSLSTEDDPARHLDALPRRHEAGDSQHSERLRSRLYSTLAHGELVPNQDGELRELSDISYPPRDLTIDGAADSAAFERWEASPDRPKDWLHHRALTRNRMGRLETLHQERHSRPLPRATITEWLEALVEDAKFRLRYLSLIERMVADANKKMAAASADSSQDASDTVASYEERIKNLREYEDIAYEEIVRSSMSAIQTAALIPESVRKARALGDIVFTADRRWVAPDPDAVWLGGGYDSRAGALVNPHLEADPETLSALKELGIRPASPTTVFEELASVMLTAVAKSNDDWRDFWNLSRRALRSAAVDAIKSREGWRNSLRVRTMDGSWRSLFEALLPGRIAPADSSRDSVVVIDVAGFHRDDLRLIEHLGAVDAPRAEHELARSHLLRFTDRCRSEFVDRNTRGSTPQWDRLKFASTATTGPLNVLETLSEEGCALYTWDLLGLPATYQQWHMRHDSPNRRDYYGTVEFESPAIEALRQCGRVRTDDGGIHRLSDAFGDPPKNRAVLRKLLSHPKSDLIRKGFGLNAEADDLLDPIGADEPMLLIDVWPDLESHLSPRQAELQVIRCDGFDSVDGLAPSCIVRGEFVYVTRRDDERDELQSILDHPEILLPYTACQILEHRTPEDVRAAREAVRKCATDEERLLKAVGEDALRRRLPSSLIPTLEDIRSAPLAGVDIAHAAIATFHTGALREYRYALAHLDPPYQWAGRPKAVEFVRSLGFGEEWAGDSRARRDPYIEVEGPYPLPPLHDYQRNVVENVKNLIRSRGVGERRGMVSMPTGSGKTRVAVQAIVEAIREGGSKGGVLWVADRDELCEQAVEAWRQVWVSEGAQAKQLRISRMWAGQPQPLPTANMHVVVATIQTLSAKIDRQPDSYEFLADFDLLVFDEAHRSVAPTFTAVMEELGLTRWRRPTEPLLIGLTATPYRGHDESETARLVNRYGSNRLDAGAFASDEPEYVISELQAMRVLAQADHGTIEGGDFFLSDDERRQAREVPWLPRSVENRIAQDVGRTRRIVEAYMEHVHNVDPDWPALVFATSVEHSQTMAALLTSQGIEARSVSGSTDTSVRRRIVDEFRAGEVKALVNYGVFREGFDAPSTRAIIVARPVYSPNLYFQMIGRGLRGVKNGGKDRCLILNVRDNIINFGRELAFSELDWLWTDQ